MKVALVTSHSFLKPGGVKRHILGLHGEFRRRGIESRIIVPRRKRREKYKEDIILMGTAFPLKIAGTQADICVNFDHFAIERLLKKEKFDIIHFHNFGIPSAIQLLERSKSLNVMTLHANLEKNKWLENFPGFLRMITRVIQWKMDGIIGVAPLNLKVIKGYRGLKTVIPNGIDLKEFNPSVRKLKKYSDGRLNILFLGRIEERKGLIYLLKAMKMLDKKYDNLRLIVAGSGPLKKQCRSWARDNGLKNVVFAGEIREEEVPSYYASCDIYCSPAIYGESFGIVLVEAMAAGKPVVGFGNEGYEGVLKKTKGERFLVKNKDSQALAKALGELISDEGLRKEMGQWGIEEAKKYSWSKIADQVLEFYEECRKEKARR